MSNSYEKRSARIVCSSTNAVTPGDTVSNFQVTVNACGFYSMEDEYYFLKLEEVSPVILDAVPAGLTSNAAPLEVLLTTIGQDGSYDTRSQTETFSVGIMRKVYDYQNQTTTRVGYECTGISAWSGVKIKRDAIMNKPWRIMLRPVDQSVHLTQAYAVTSNVPAIAVFTVSKDPI